MGVARASRDLATRLERLQAVAQVLPSLVAPAAPIAWTVDIPNDTFYHVGGSFNDVFAAWPHCYYVMNQTGHLVYRTPYVVYHTLF